MIRLKVNRVSNGGGGIACYFDNMNEVIETITKLHEDYDTNNICINIDTLKKDIPYIAATEIAEHFSLSRQPKETERVKAVYEFLKENEKYHGYIYDYKEAPDYDKMIYNKDNVKLYHVPEGQYRDEQIAVVGLSEAEYNWLITNHYPVCYVWAG